MTHDDLDYTLSCLRRSVENGSTWTLYPAGAAALVGEVERLRAEIDILQQEARIRKAINEGLASEVSYFRACVPPVHPGDYGHEAWTETVRAAVDAERAAVLRWLRRGDANVYPSWVTLADEIERGEHRREEER